MSTFECARVVMVLVAVIAPIGACILLICKFCSIEMKQQQSIRGVDVETRSPQSCRHANLFSIGVELGVVGQFAND